MIRASIAMTQDGFCDHDKIIADAEHHEHAARQIAEADVLLLGRNTYDLFEQFWPEAENNPEHPHYMRLLAAQLRAKPKVVATSRPQVWSWHNTSTLEQLDAEILSTYRGEDTASLLVMGSPSIVRSLLIMGLLDELHIQHQPITAGGGNALFSRVPEHFVRSLKLQDKVNLGSGVCNMKYLCTSSRGL